VSADRCPLCDGVTVVAFSVGDRNRGIGDEVFVYRRCLHCRTLYLAEPPTDLGRHYPDEYYELPAVAELDRAANAEQPKLALMRRFAASGSLVDIGAGSGLFARAARNAGYDVTAIEMDARCCEYLQRVVDVRVIRSREPDRALAGLDPVRVITLWHVLEHLPRPWGVLEAVAARLESGGVAVVATPNPDSLQFRLLGERWAHVDAPRHLFLIPLSTLTDRAGELGLDVALATTADAAGRHWNRFGWEYALRGNPVERGPSRAMTGLSMVVATLIAPLERRGLRGAAYTAVFVKR
jgi:SAM-dependent methyltransferase